MPLTKEDLNAVKLEPPDEGTLLPVNANWSINVNGRQFGEFMAIARQKPRRSILFLPIADPCSLFANTWGSIATFTDFTYTAFVVPLSLAFNDYTDPNAYWYMDFLGSIIYIVDFIIEFHVGFIVRWDSSSVTITDGIQVAKNYMKNGTLWIDIISCLPIIGQIVIVATTGEKMSSNVIRSILLLKLLRLGRVIRLIGRMNRVGTGGILHQWIAARVNSVTMFIFNTFFSLMVMINLLACLWWWIADTQGLENSWVGAVAINKPEIELINGSDGIRWLVCAYYSLVTMATIGYGDIVPVTSVEIGLVILFIFCGVAYFGFVLSTVSALLESRSTEDTLSGGNWSKFQEMEVFVQRFSFPKRLQREIRRHCYAASISSVTGTPEADFYGFLPLWLKLKVAVELQKTGIIALVGGQSVWDSLPSDTQDAVSKVVAVASTPQSLNSSMKLHAAGDLCDSIYFLEEGQIGFFVPNVATVVTVSSPAVLGAGALFGSWSEVCATWKSTAITATRCFLWKFNAAKIQKGLMDAAPEVLQLILDHYLEELKNTRSGLDVYGTATAQSGLSMLRKAYDDKIQGALYASDELTAAVQVMKEEKAAKEAARCQRLQAEEDAQVQQLDMLKKAGMVEAEIAAEASGAQGGAANFVSLHTSVANTSSFEIDLEQNLSSTAITQVIERRLDRKQYSMHLEEQALKEASATAAVGILRKKGNTTFVV